MVEGDKEEDNDYQKARDKNLQRAKDAAINKHMYSKNEPLLVSDVIFQMVNSAFNRLVPYIHNFEKEADELMKGAGFTGGAVKDKFRVNRAYVAKEQAYLIALEID